jgi:hypothetical protein
MKPDNGGFLFLFEGRNHLRHTGFLQSDCGSGYATELEKLAAAVALLLHGLPNGFAHDHLTCDSNWRER